MVDVRGKPDEKERAVVNVSVEVCHHYERGKIWKCNQT